MAGGDQLQLEPAFPEAPSQHGAILDGGLFLRGEVVEAGLQQVLEGGGQHGGIVFFSQELPGAIALVDHAQVEQPVDHLFNEVGDAFGTLDDALDDRLGHAGDLLQQAAGELV